MCIPPLILCWTSLVDNPTSSPLFFLTEPWFCLGYKYCQWKIPPRLLCSSQWPHDVVHSEICWGFLRRLLFSWYRNSFLFLPLPLFPYWNMDEKPGGAAAILLDIMGGRPTNWRWWSEAMKRFRSLVALLSSCTSSGLPTHRFMWDKQILNYLKQR